MEREIASLKALLEQNKRVSVLETGQESVMRPFPQESQHFLPGTAPSFVQQSHLDTLTQ